MAYDMNHDRWASPNSPFFGVTDGLAEYWELGISTKQIVLGLPWYGYDFPCKETDPKTEQCTTKTPEFQHTYPEILQLLQNSTTGRLWGYEALSPYFNYVAKDGVHQVWYDDPESIGLKVKLAHGVHLRGIGIWTADFLDYSGNNYQAMWKALSA
jgi:di-N-acetylchitobiase